ncbi:MAG: helix-turn-helix transcriptional regulator [Burkholderiaceae bacterium]|nr:helix-turn-helix transcriptional regulator [Burkholderiaceae bacterium]
MVCCIRGGARPGSATVPIYEFSAIGSAVRTRRTDMGLTQARVAELGCLSLATVELLESGSIGELNWAHAVRLLSVVGLSVRVSNPRSTRRQREEGIPALEVAARSASTSYRELLSPDDLRVALLTTTYPKNFAPHVLTFLDEAHVSQIADVVEKLHHETGINRVEAWQRMREMARAARTVRDIWL